jgi:predicted dehydrogenase
MSPLRVAVVGCGNISRAYVDTLLPYDEVELVGAVDLDHERARALASVFGGRAYESFEEVLADESVDAVLNLVGQTLHADITERSLEAGKHVHSEKPLALTYERARELVECAARNDRLLSASPITFLGEAQSTARKQLDEGRLGQLRVVYAEGNWGPIEAWHPEPVPFYEVGPLYDVGVYPLTLLTTFLGPVRSVVGYGKVVQPDRVTLAGDHFHVTVPEFVVALVEFESVVARVTLTFYTPSTTKQGRALEFHGDEGSLYLGNSFQFDAPVEFARPREAYEPVPLEGEPYHGTEWGRGVVDLARAVAERRQPYSTGEQAAHVVETIEAIRTSWTEMRRVDVGSTFASPASPIWDRTPA